MEGVRKGEKAIIFLMHDDTPSLFTMSHEFIFALVIIIMQFIFAV